jgi:hypothetical protein
MWCEDIAMCSGGNPTAILAGTAAWHSADVPGGFAQCGTMMAHGEIDRRHGDRPSAADIGALGAEMSLLTRMIH